jgi:hypothetical protein
LAQGLLVFEDEGIYRVVTRITHENRFSSPVAGEAIQHALDALPAEGGAVFVEQGRYPLAAPLRLRSHTRLQGAGRGTRLVVSAEIGILGEGLDGAEVADLALVAEGAAQAQAGLAFDACGDCRAANVLAAGFAAYGIWLRNDSFLCTINGCSAAGNGVANLYLDNLAAHGRAGEFVPNLVTNCMVYGGHTGIETRRTIVANIVGCCVFQARAVGFHVHSESNSVVISGCRTFQIGRQAVLLEDTDEFNLSSNIFCWHIEDGVVIRNANWGTITANEVIDTGSYNSGVPDRTADWSTLPKDLPAYSGIKLLNARGYTVTGNSIFNWPVCPPMEYGIYEDDASFQNIMTGNNVNYYTGGAVACHGRESLAAHNVGHAERPHQDRGGLHHFYQTFQTELTERFIQDQWAGA